MKQNKAKYNQIVEAAVEVIAENGFNASQVAKIANKANVADGTIYLYFKNKEDILISVFKEKMGEFIKKIAESIQYEKNAEAKLYMLINMHFQQLADDHHLAVVTQLELRQSNIKIRQEINQILKPYLTVIDDIIKEGIKEKTFRDNLNIPLVRQMIFGTLDEIVTNWVMKGQRYELVSQSSDVHAFITSGLSANY